MLLKLVWIIMYMILLYPLLIIAIIINGIINFIIGVFKVVRLTIASLILTNAHVISDMIINSNPWVAWARHLWFDEYSDGNKHLQIIGRLYLKNPLLPSTVPIKILGIALPIIIDGISKK